MLDGSSVKHLGSDILERFIRIAQRRKQKREWKVWTLIGNGEFQLHMIRGGGRRFLGLAVGVDHYALSTGQAQLLRGLVRPARENRDCAVFRETASNYC